MKRMLECKRKEMRTGAVQGSTVILAMLALCLTAALSAAGELVQRYDFEAPSITELDGMQRIEMPGTWSYGDPGQPVLPLAPVRLLLSPGETITGVEIEPGERVLLEGSYFVEVGQKQYPLSHEGAVIADGPDPQFYASSAPFPGRLNDEPHVGLFRGYRIATFALHPVEYIPAEGRISYLRDCTVRITTEYSPAAYEESAQRIRHDGATLARLAGLVDNPADAALYADVAATGGSRLLDSNDAYRYLILTTDTWSNYLGDLVDFETQRGHKAGIFLRSWMTANYAGQDEADRIRNFIIDAYQTWGSDYVLIVGDTDALGIPYRGLYAVAYGTTDTNIPADLYFSCLDGNWNSDGDGYWGEPGEADLYHELGIGRVCITNTEELQNFLTKTVRYQTEPILQESAEALMVGELLWSEPTWGGDYKDEVLYGADTWGYTTVGFPPTMNVDTLYDREGTWSAATLINMMSNGLNIINHLGHCDTGYMMKFYISNIPQFTNDGLNHSYNFIYSQGCYPGNFPDNCIGEQLHCDVHGAVAEVLNSRYGWGQHASTNGSSQYFDREFFDAMFGEGIYALADANDDSKMDVIWALDYGANRWCFYELNLFGDPAMELWTGVPGTVSVDLPDAVFIGAPELEIGVTTPMGAPIAGARVTVFSDDYSVYGTAVSDAFGIATLQLETEEPGDLHVMVCAHDRLDYEGQLTVVPPDGPYLICEAVNVLDPDGDDDGILDEGEVPGIEIILKNVGIAGTANISALLSCEDECIEIMQAEGDYPDIPAEGSGCCIEPFIVHIAGDSPDGHLLQFTVVASSDDGSWESHFNLGIQAPILNADGVTVVDVPGGNGDGGADAGETFDLWLRLANTGHSAAEDLSAVISTMSPYVVLIDAGGVCDDVPVDGEGSLGAFNIQLSPDCPEPTHLDFHVDLSAANGFAGAHDFSVAVGGWFDDLEEDRDWSVGADGDNASSGIWTRVDPIGTTYNGEVVQPEDDHTPDPAVNCFITGQHSPGESAGYNDVDGGKTTLLSPVFHLSGAISATVSYWRWYTNNLGNNPDEDWWDVDVTSDGITWVSLEHTQASATEWLYFEFALEDYVTLTDHVQIRFVAADEVNGSLVEAGVDDFLLDAWIPIQTGVDEAPSALLSLGANYPNPFNPRTTLRFTLPEAGKVELTVHDVAGRLVRQLVDGNLVAGPHELVWDGQDDSGHSLASGVYFSRLSFGGELKTGKMLLLK